MVAIAVFLGTYYMIQTGSVRLALYAAIPTMLIAVVFLASPQFRHFILENIFQLHSESRGIGSGFTGRIEAWKQAIDAFWDRPVLGYGFRATTQARGGSAYGAIHSGYLKLFVETGFVGGILVVSAIVLEALRRLRLALRFTNLRPGSVPGIDVVETARINTVACATLLLTMTIWVYDQLYVNLGSVISIVLFLMIAAPVYIPTQGVGLRR
jgi:O-antigen ligase